MRIFISVKILLVLLFNLNITCNTRTRILTGTIRLILSNFHLVKFNVTLLYV